MKPRFAGYNLTALEPRKYRVDKAVQMLSPPPQEKSVKYDL
jgi:hypothetical protein